MKKKSIIIVIVVMAGLFAAGWFVFKSGYDSQSAELADMDADANNNGQELLPPFPPEDVFSPPNLSSTLEPMIEDQKKIQASAKIKKYKSAVFPPLNLAFRYPETWSLESGETSGLKGKTAYVYFSGQKAPPIKIKAYTADYKPDRPFEYIYQYNHEDCTVLTSTGKERIFDNKTSEKDFCLVEPLILNDDSVSVYYAKIPASYKGKALFPNSLVGLVTLKNSDDYKVMVITMSLYDISNAQTINDGEKIIRNLLGSIHNSSFPQDEEIPDITYNNLIPEKDAPVVVYAESVGYFKNKPIYRLWKKEGGKKPKLLVTAGVIDGLFSSDILQHDPFPEDKEVFLMGDPWLVGAGSEQFIKRDTAKRYDEVREFYENRTWLILTMCLSKDEKQMLVIGWDENNRKNIIDLYNFDKKTAKMIFNGYIGMDVVSAWDEKNNRLVGYATKGEGPGSPRYLDLETGEVTEPFNFDREIPTEPGPKGTYYLSADKTISTDCSMIGYEVSTYFILDPITGEKRGKFGVEGKIIRVVAFSPTGSELIYSVVDPPTNGKCVDYMPDSQKTYYLIKTDNPEQKTLVKNLQSILGGWSQSGFTETGDNNGTKIFSKKGDLLFTLPSDLHLVGIYY